MALISYYVEKRRATRAGPGRHCPICGWSGPEFFPIVHPGIGMCRAKAACPTCGSLERHRALYFFYRDFFGSRPSHAHVVHFAPEPCFRTLFTAHARHYFTSNFGAAASDIKLDLNRLGLRDNAIDLIVANSVLTATDGAPEIKEEMYRVLKPGGFALVCDVVLPSARRRELPHRPVDMQFAFGELDIEDDFRGFELELRPIVSFVPEADRARLGANAGEFHMIKLRKVPPS